MLRRRTLNSQCPSLNFFAFTLLELLVVLAIMALLTGMSVPAISGYIKGARLKGGTTQIASALRTARAYAITKRQRYMVIFATDTSSKLYMTACKIYQAEEGTIEEWNYLPDNIIIDSDSANSTFITSTDSTIPFPNDDDSPGTLAKIEFKANGAATLNRTIRVKNSNDSSQFREITYNNTTGRIKVGKQGQEL
ncbi:prepilin-type N-terminal cleavage/methylation domain-containing protein [bacterium]|nr:prepilin-type N-terminal cleavage/methylation domain-containing protein [bacterium]